MATATDRQMRELEAFAGCGAPVLSLYLNTGSAATVADMNAAVDRLVKPIAESVEEPVRADLRMEVAAIRDYLGSLVCTPVALAIFTCSRRRFFRVLRLDEPVAQSAWWQDVPQTQELRDAIDRVSGDRDGQLLAPL